MAQAPATGAPVALVPVAQVDARTSPGAHMPATTSVRDNADSAVSMTPGVAPTLAGADAREVDDLL